MTSAEKPIENLYQEVYRSLGKMFHSPARETVWVWSFADVESPMAT